MITVHQAWQGVMHELEAIGKGNKGHGYQYRGIDDVMNALHPLIAEHGLAIVPSGIEVVEIVGTPGRKDGWTSTRAKHRFTVYGPDGSSFEGEALGEGTSNQGTGPGIAASYAYKTFCLQLFCIPTEDLKDAEEIPPAEGAPVQQPAPQDPRAVKIVGLMTDASDDIKTAWKKANGDNPHRITDSEALDRALAHAEALVAGNDFAEEWMGDGPDGAGLDTLLAPEQGTLEGAA